MGASVRGACSKMKKSEIFFVCDVQMRLASLTSFGERKEIYYTAAYAAFASLPSVGERKEIYL